MAIQVQCKICDSGTLIRRKKYRMSGPVVFIGYILLIPSILGILFSAFMFFSTVAATDSTREKAKQESTEKMQAAGIPPSVVNAVVVGNDNVVNGWLNEDSNQYGGGNAWQVQVVKDAQDNLRSSNTGDGLAFGVVGGVSIFMGIASLVAGLLGWLLVMKKWVLQCNVCNAVVNAS